LEDRGIDPAANENRAFFLACEGGRLRIAKLLLELKDRGIDPTAGSSKALIRGCGGEFLEVVKL